MGLGMCCTKKVAEIEGDIVLEKTSDGEIKVQLQVNDNNEKAFEDLYSKLHFINDSVKEKWKELPKFNYEIRRDTNELEITKDMQTPNGTYYGFM